MKSIIGDVRRTNRRGLKHVLNGRVLLPVLHLARWSKGSPAMN